MDGPPYFSDHPRPKTRLETEHGHREEGVHLVAGACCERAGDPHARPHDGA